MQKGRDLENITCPIHLHCGTLLNKHQVNSKKKIKKGKRERKGNSVIVGFLMIMHKALSFLQLGSVHGNEV